MRPLIAGLTLVATLAAAVPAGAQVNPMMGGTSIGQRASANAQRADESSKLKANDKAYSSALKNLPDKHYDPWRGVR
jgi:hypothetical protein